MLVGRSDEQARIDRLLARSAGSAGGMLILRGDAGIGKSALLEYAASHAGDADSAALERIAPISANLA